MPRPAHHLGIVGGFFAVRPGPVRFEEGSEFESLRRLHAKKPVPRENVAGDAIAGADQSVGDGKGREGTCSSIEAAEKPLDYVGRNEGARGIVNEDVARLLIGESFETLQNR